MLQSKTQTGKLNKKSKPIGMLYPDLSHKQGHTKTQNQGLVEDLPIKWRGGKNKQKENKTGVVTFVSDKIDFNSNKE